MVECIERISGMDFRDYLRSHILDPSGLSSLFVGLPEEIQPQYQPHWGQPHQISKPLGLALF